MDIFFSFSVTSILLSRKIETLAIFDIVDFLKIIFYLKVLKFSKNIHGCAQVLKQKASIEKYKTIAYTNKNENLDFAYLKKVAYSV